jgi:hypothetical protein
MPPKYVAKVANFGFSKILRAAVVLWLFTAYMQSRVGNIGQGRIVQGTESTTGAPVGETQGVYN